MFDFEKTVNTLPSLETRSHAHIIYGLIRWLRPQRVLEVGSHAGYISCWLAKGLQDNGLPESTLYLMDDFSLGSTSANLSNALNLCGVQTVPHIILQGRSDTLTWPGIDFAFIDGDHSYEGCYDDVQRALHSGATCIVVHDTCGWWGPRRLLEELEQNDKVYTLEANHDSGLGIIMVKQPKPAAIFTNGKDIHDAKPESTI